MKPFAPLLAALTLAAAPAAFAQAPAAAPPPPVPAADFLAANAKAAGVKTLPSGLQYKVIAAGPAGGPAPKPGDVIKVHYEGALTNGAVFDSSFQRGKAEIMALDSLVPGWMEGIPLMHVGDEWMLYLPPDLGYGADGAGPIPPGAALVFRIKLIGMLSAD